MKIDKLKSQARHEFMKEYFFKGSPDRYSVKIIGKYALVKQWNGGSNRWEVAVWFKDVYDKATYVYQKGLLDGNN